MCQVGPAEILIAGGNDGKQKLSNGCIFSTHEQQIVKAIDLGDDVTTFDVQSTPIMTGKGVVTCLIVDSANTLQLVHYKKVHNKLKVIASLGIVD